MFFYFLYNAKFRFFQICNFFKPSSIVRIFSRKVSGKHIFCENNFVETNISRTIAKISYHQDISQKIVPLQYFSCCWQVLPFFLRNLGKSQLILIFTKIFAKLYHIFARKCSQTCGGWSQFQRLYYVTKVTCKLSDHWGNFTAVLIQISGGWF